MGDRNKAETLLRDAVKLDPGAVKPKIQLARLLTATKPAEADKLIDEAIAAGPHRPKRFRSRGRCRGAEATRRAPCACSMTR